MPKTPQELDAVRIVQLKEHDRSVDGSSSVKRSPLVGDSGTVVAVLGPKRFWVESVNPDGLTIWLADFDLDELEVTTPFTD